MSQAACWERPGSQAWRGLCAGVFMVVVATLILKTSYDAFGRYTRPTMVWRAVEPIGFVCSSTARVAGISWHFYQCGRDKTGMGVGVVFSP